MGRYTGPKCKLSRREGTDLEHKSRLRTGGKPKFDVNKKPGVGGSGRLTDYGVQFRMKQLVKRYYLVSEKQFRAYYTIADRRKGTTGTELLRLLESRLDNVVYRLGFASTRSEARQLVSHKAILVNGELVNIASYRVRPGDIVSVRERAQKQMRIQAAMELNQTVDLSPWLSLNSKEMSGVFKAHPELEDLPAVFKVNLVVELYSK